MEAAKRGEVVKASSMKRVIVDTTVMEKAITYLTDSRLLERSRTHLVKAATEHGLTLRQNYNRLAPRLSIQLNQLQFEVLELDTEDAKQAAEIRAYLAIQGTPIGPYDVLIAGQARARNLTLITHNVREFTRVPKLNVEDWEQ